jgi:hypothetical protein
MRGQSHEGVSQAGRLNPHRGLALAASAYGFGASHRGGSKKSKNLRYPIPRPSLGQPVFGDLVYL